ncbi:MAG TPA: cobyrinate a,c-diamide synthase [Burkholderiales bacterium]|nr:cobyrinate a,c-diamide synthase [Burkholderiales bacterium]
MAHVFISAAHKSSGKTTLTLGLAAAFARRGLAVQPFKKGPDYIDPMWLSLAAGRACRNLDFHLMTREEIRASFARHARAADLSLIEGNKGLYDGLDLHGSNSNAALAALLGSPVVLVIDARGMTRGIAPLILGYQAFDPSVRIAGVILNNLGGARHEHKLRAVIAHYTGVEVIGAVPHDETIAIVERHLGLVPSNEAAAAAAIVEAVRERVEQSVDLDRLLAIAASAASLPEAPAARAPRGGSRLRVGIARDEAFGFYYADDLEALAEAGAEVVAIDTLRADRLPAIDALVIGGGFPETQMRALEANEGLRRELARAIEAGLPVYAECGGLMYLARSISWRGETARMVGALPGDAVMHARPVGRGYARLEGTPEAAWLPGGEGEIAAHEFHYASLENLAPGLRYAYRVARGHGVDGARDGIVHRNVLASFCHLRGAGERGWVAPFVEFARRRSA